MAWLPIGYSKTPWGFTLDSKGLVAIASVKARNERAELGEFAIELFASLGITEEKLLDLRANPEQTKGLQLMTNCPEKFGVTL